MLKKIILITSIFFICKANFAQKKENNTFTTTIIDSTENYGNRFEFLPPGLNFMPLKAASDEPKMGLNYFTATSNMRVDIGNSFDVCGYNFDSAKSRLTLGVEFFADAYVTSYLSYRLQIDAIDGFFGGNIIYSKKLVNNKLFIRFRYIHSSAHLVDGHWDAANLKWMDNQYPSPYGNNYGELVFANESNNSINYLRYYGGFSFSTGKKTGDKKLEKIAYKLGLEYAFSNLLGKVFEKDENIFVAANFDVKGIPEYIINQNYMAGIKFGEWLGKGLIFYLSYYNGGDVFNQYFNVRVSRFGIGFMFDFI